MWQIRKLYGGGTPLPPTDPRILALTPEQIAVDLAHLALDNPDAKDNARRRESAFDPEFAEYEQKIADEARAQAQKAGIAPLQEATYEEYAEDEIQWEDVERD